MPLSMSTTEKFTIDRREVGRLVGTDPGPTLAIVAGIHGNEPAGIHAARRVFARLERGDIRTRGEFIVFAGNVASLNLGIRYQVKDLNRCWSEDQVRELSTKTEKDAEDLEQVELLAALDAAVGRSRGRVHIGDFHTTSASGIPFVLFGDTLPQRQFVRVFPLPIIMGLEELVDGVLASYWTRRNCVAFSCEGGQHDDPASIDSLEAVLWLALEEAGVTPRGLPEALAGAELLNTQRGNIPRVLEVLERRAITENDAFRMEPGFRNLDNAHEGRLLARDRNGDIRAPSDGIVMLPLYQGLGSDGFFWGRGVSQTRMKAIDVLRQVGADRLLGLLPGVKRDDANPERLVLRRAAAKLYPRDVFNFFGYRKAKNHGEHLTLERSGS